MGHQFPQNFVTLHTGEEILRAKSVAAIQASENLRLHAVFIERCMDTIEYLCRQYDTKDADELIVQHLGARMFNASASALKLLLSGYYQASALQQRDMLETVFLLDYFTTNHALITQWNSLAPKERWKEFKPILIRAALDKRDGFINRKRQEAYDLLSELAGHPTPQGFVMLRPQGKDAHLGPFFDDMALDAVLSELANNVGQAADHINCLCATEALPHFPAKILFLEAQSSWMERFFDRAPDRTRIEKAWERYKQWAATAKM